MAVETENETENGMKMLEEKPRPLLINEDGTPTNEGWKKIGIRLRAEIPHKTYKGRGGLSFKYITARQAQDRLDEIGLGNWSTSYRVLDVANAIVECTITLFGVSKADVGYPNNPENPEEEALKSAYSDSFKRAAVAFGIGRFLYGES